MLWQWRKKNPDLVRAQKGHYFERKVWPRVPRTRQRKDQDGNEYDPDEILWDFFGVCVVLTYLRKRVPRSWQRKEKDGDECNPDEILQDLFGVSAVLTHFRKSLPLPLPPRSRQRSRKSLAYSFSSSDSKTDEALSKELDLMLAKPEEPVERRMEEIRKNRKKAEANRVRCMLKKQKQEEKIITAIATELDGVTSMLHDLDKWFTQFESEDTVAQATQFSILTV